MKAPYRSALLAAGFAAAVAVTTAPAVAGAQRNQPGPDTKRVLVTAFRGDAEGGVRIADEIRGRVSSEFSIRQLMPNSKKDIDNTLVSSGYKPDSALNPNDIKELAKLVRADEIIDGTVTKTPTGFRTSARFFLPRDPALSQPLITADNANLGDVAKDIVREYDAARKQLQANQACENGIRDRKLDVAIAEARKGIQEYPKATLARLCLASAFTEWKNTADSSKGWADSVIKVTKEVTALDQFSKIAYTLQYGAYKAKNDTANALQALVGMMKSDPTNAQLREDVIAELVKAGKPEIAIPTAKQLRDENVGDAQYARLYWLVLRAARHYKESVPAGEEYVKLDTAGATLNYFINQASDLAADSAYARAAEVAARAAAKFPKDASILVLEAQNERKAGQLPAAKATIDKALALDPRAPGAAPLAITINIDLGNVPDAVKIARAAVAADSTSKPMIAAFLLSGGNTLYKQALASKKVEDFRKAVELLKASDEINPSANAAFLTAVATFSILQSDVGDLQKSKSCADAKASADDLTTINSTLMRGGSVSVDAAKQIAAAVQQYQPYVDQMNKKVCK